MKLRFAIALTLASSFAALHAAEPPHPLLHASGDASAYSYIDFATLYDAKLREAIETANSPEVEKFLLRIELQIGMPLAALQSVTFVMPKAKDSTACPIRIAVARPGTDPKVLVSHLKKLAPSMGLEFGEKGGLAWAISKPNGNRVGSVVESPRHYEMIAPDRIAMVEGLDTADLKAAREFTGVHAARLKADADAVFSCGVHFAGLTEKQRTLDRLYSPLLSAKPLFDSEAGWITGRLEKDRIDFRIRMQCQDKNRAADAIDSLEDTIKFAHLSFKAWKRNIADQLEEPEGMSNFIDTALNAIGELKFARDGSASTATASLKLEKSLVPVVAYFSGGGVNAHTVISIRLQRLGLAMNDHEDAKKKLPSPNTNGSKGMAHSWRVQLLPFLEQSDLYKQFRLDEPWDSEHNLKVVEDNPMPEIYTLPGSKNLTDKTTHFQVFVGDGAYFELGKTLSVIANDGCSNTLLIALAERAVPWTKPDDIEFDPEGKMMAKLWFDKKDRSFAVFGDGHVAIIKRTMKEEVLKALITRNGGEIVDEKDR